MVTGRRRGRGGRPGQTAPPRPGPAATGRRCSIDGRSPAPRAVGDLLIALRKAGATAISAPVCAECGKQLRTLQRRGQDWYCGVCGPVREPCGECGRHPPDPYAGTGTDDHAAWRARPTTGVTRSSSGRRDRRRRRGPVDRVAAAAVRFAAPRAGQRHQLAWALQDRPELLTGAGAHAPARSVLRLIDALCDAGASAIVRPPCPRCGRVIHLHKRLDGKWLCRNCIAKSRAEPCGAAARSANPPPATSTGDRCVPTA